MLLLGMSSCTVQVMSRMGETGIPIQEKQGNPFWLIGFFAGAGFRLLVSRVSRRTAVISVGAFVICVSAFYYSTRAPRKPLVARNPYLVPPTRLDKKKGQAAAVQPVLLNPQLKTFVVDTRMDAPLATRGRCWLTTGTVLARPPGGARRGTLIPVVVQTSKPGDCPVKSQVLVEASALLRMHTHAQKQSVSSAPPPPPALPVAPPVAPPAVVAFEAVPSTAEQCAVTILRWSVTGATRISIEPGVGTVNANAYTTVRPVRTALYTLKAEGAGGEVTRDVTVTVSNPTRSSCGP